MVYSLPSGAGHVGLESDGMGNLYGVASNGGENRYGLMFKIENTGIYSPIYHFRYDGSADGRFPSSLTYDGTGKFYGVTCEGGGWPVYGPAGGYTMHPGNGSVFTVDANGVYKTIRIFKNNTQDAPEGGQCPRGKLALDNNGNYYGVTIGGGERSLLDSDQGVVFNSSAKVFTFSSNKKRGARPNGMTGDGAGNFYGVTASGAGYNGGSAGGSIFKITNTGTSSLYSLVYSFAEGDVGSEPLAALTRDNFGNFYGTASAGGKYGKGTIFKLAATGIITAIHHFSGGDGSYPSTRLISDDNGNFYGVTSTGGTSDGFGVIFKITEYGDYSVIYSFSKKNHLISEAEGKYSQLTLETKIDGFIYGVISGVKNDGSAGVARIFKFPVN